MPGKSLMPIGRFARSCRLSVKALRHYDELGLLRPALVDAQSGYRYYAREQARQAVMIGMLRSLDLPLPVVQRLLGAAPDELATLVAGETSRVEAELAARQRALLSLRHIAESGSLAPYDVVLVDEPARRVAQIEGVTTTERLVPDTTELVYAVVSEALKHGIGEGGVVGSINEFHSDDERVRVTSFVELPEAVEPGGRAVLGELPAVSCATLVHVGPYETLGIAHHALHAWVHERGHEPAGPIWEFYRNDPADVDIDALETRVALPLVRGRTP